MLFQSHNCVNVVLQTIEIVIAKAAKTSGKFARVKDGVMAFRNPVEFVNVKSVDDWSRHEGIAIDRDISFGSPSGSGFHVVSNVNLGDRFRVAELLNLVSANGGQCWDTCTRKHRLDAMEDWSRAFCVDCLTTWWEKRGRNLAEQAILKIKVAEIRERDNDPKGCTEAEVVDPTMPQLIPAIKFLARFPEILPPGTALEENEVRMLPPNLNYLECRKLPDWMVDDFEDDI
ncbi:hypothetical protein ColTof3_14387 [Colletotrichum tofieldiae]|nr:hypothetical protein ColTof3_14387 [Colletotrichum tofieldiae]